MKKILMSLTAAVAILLIAVIVLRASQITSLLSKQYREINLEGVKVKTVGIGELQVANFLPIVQIFVGKAVHLEKVQLSSQPSTVSAGQLTLTLPAGWDKKEEYATDSTYAVLLRDKDGNFATISQSAVSDPQTFLADVVQQYSSLLELSGFAVTPYTLAMPDGQRARAVDAQSANLAIQLRAWVSEETQKAYLVVLTSSLEDLMVSQKIFASFSH